MISEEITELLQKVAIEKIVYVGYNFVEKQQFKMEGFIHFLRIDFLPKGLASQNKFDGCLLLDPHSQQPQKFPGSVGQVRASNIDNFQ